MAVYSYSVEFGVEMWVLRNFVEGYLCLPVSPNPLVSSCESVRGVSNHILSIMFLSLEGD